MSEFKYACPVCGQHIRCDSSQAGSVMECPTCFQKITVPQAPATEDAKFIITGTKVGERPVPKIPESGPLPAAEKKSTLAAALIVLVILAAAGASVFAFREKIFKSAQAPVTPVNAAPAQSPAAPPAPPPWPVVEVPADLPLPAGTNYWTLNVSAVGTPDVPAGGKVHGRFFTAGRMILNKDGLTIRTPDLPPDAGVTIYLRPNPIESLYGKSFLFQTNTPGAPGVFLRWKNAQGQEASEMKNTGYALRIEFGNPEGNHISGKIYLSAPDQLKSYVVGDFNAEIVKPKPE